MNITAKIQELRKAKKWSVAKLAREAGIPTVSLRAMLAREDPNAYNVKNLIKIAKALGVTVSYLTQTQDFTSKPQLTLAQKRELMEDIEKEVAKAIDKVLEKHFNIQGENNEE